VGDSISVEIINWSTHNPRSSIKHPRWFALSNRILENPEMFSLNDAEFKAWIYVLCQASQKNSSVVEIHLTHADRVCGVKTRILQSALAKLENAKCIQLRDHGVNTSVPEKATTLHNKTEQTEQNKQNNIAHAEAFAEFYRGYPRKIGRSKAEKAYEREIKAGATPGLILESLSRFRVHHETAGTEKNFIPHPATFLSSWRDSLDPDYGTSDLVQTSGGLSEAELAIFREDPA
jgi:hypothetical protein